VIRPQYSPLRGQELDVDKPDIDRALRINFSGDSVGLLREGPRLMPIMLQTSELERQNIDHLGNIQEWSQTQQRYVPLANLV
ncbi:hypothetical protein, partial [Pantoea sp. GbtcB22]|uniref:hypothetical protein n=1 Tax=Pantoea sp. GbtcB22 TaxID=2824767 RepID=UPI001C307E9C